MQPAFHFRPRATVRNPALLAVILSVAVGGCRPPRPVEVPKPRPFAGQTVRLACADPEYAKELIGRGRIWGVRTGGTVVLEGEEAKADVAVLPPAQLGRLAAADVLATRPTALGDRDQTLRWTEVLPAFQDKLCNWGRRPVAVPIAGDGYVLVYRADRFADPAAQAAHRAKFQRELTPPATWEDLARAADTLAATSGKPSLPPLPADPTAAAVALNQVAACYDRTAASAASTPSGGVPQPIEPTAAPLAAFRFHVDPDTAAPRLTAPSFVAAFKWFHDTAKFRPPAGDPLNALTSGSAVAAVLPLADVARLPTGPGGLIDPRFGVAPLPGSERWFEADGQPQNAVGGRNFVPYLGTGGQLGVVFQRTTVGDAAWDFLVELASPAGAEDTLGAVKLGAGPFRYSHVALGEKAAMWQRLGFDAARTEQLARALSEYANAPLRGPVYPLRTPDQAARNAILADAVRKAASGALTGEQAAAEARQAWLAEDAKTPVATRKAWARNAVGLE